MLERLLFLALLTLLSLAAVALWRWRTQRRLTALGRLPAPDCLADLDLRPVAAVLYFSTPTCSQCRLQQTPILQRLSAEWGDDVHLCQVDAVKYEELARYFGILTIPSTVVLAASRRTIAINHGLATAERLRGQVMAQMGGTQMLVGAGSVA
jgi:thioredoxin 1